ncbi:MAG TPA: GatB/YqeY domain-containing protein [Acidimicrobiia bacterium]|jgi:hypothetical protein
MSIAEELRTELQDAMRAGDKPRVNVVRQIESEVAVAKSAPGFGGRIDDELYRATIAGYVKKMSKAKHEFEAAGDRGRAQADKLAYEIDYLARWLPETLDEEATRSLVRSVIAEMGVGDAKQAGQVIGKVMRSAKDLDGSLVAELVREELR